MASATLSKCRPILQIIYKHTHYSVSVWNLHERYYLFPRRPKSQYQFINAWFVIKTYGRLQNGRHKINEYS